MASSWTFCAVLVPLAGLLAFVSPWLAKDLLSAWRRFTALTRCKPFESLFLLIVVGVFVVYGSTKHNQIVVRNYSGTYDGLPHSASAAVRYSDGSYLLDGVFFAENPAGPYFMGEPPQYVNAGQHTIYYSAWNDGDERILGSCYVNISPRRLTDAMVGAVADQPYMGLPVTPGVTVRDGDLLTTNDYVIAYAGNEGLGTATLTVTGTNNYTGTVTRRFAISVPFGGQVIEPASPAAGRKATWTAKADAGSVFAGWVGSAVKDLGFSENQLRSPRLTMVVPEGFQADDVTAVFIPVESDGLRSLGLARTNLVCGASVDFALTHDARSLLTAKVSGLPTGLSFDAANLRIKGTPARPGVYVVKISASNASGYAWSENVLVRVQDLLAPGFIDFSQMAPVATKGEPYAGNLITDLRGYVKVTGLPSGLRFEPKTGTVVGTPRKEGPCVVTVTQTFLNGMVKEATLTMIVQPWSVPVPTRRIHYPLTLLCPPDCGTVRGGGVYPEGRTVKISANAAKGMVFAGWYQDAAFTRPVENASADYREASLQIEMVGSHRIFARFVPVGEAVESLSVLVDGKTPDVELKLAVPVGVRQRIPLAVEAISAAKVTVSGLPSGLRYDAKLGMIVGTATRASVGTFVTVRVTTAGTVLTYRFQMAAEALPAWAQGAIYSGGGMVDGELGLSALTIAASGRISGKIVTTSGTTWTMTAADFAGLTDWGAYWTPMAFKRGRETREATMWLWAEELADGSLIGHYQIEQGTERPNVAAEGWQSAFLRTDLLPGIVPVNNRVWTVEMEQGTLEFKGKAKGALSVRGVLDGVTVTGSSQLLLTGMNELGEPEYRTAVRLAARGRFKGLVWSGILNPIDPQASGTYPPNIVTTTEDVVDDHDGVTSLREALARSNEIGFALPSEGGTVCQLKSSIAFSSSKVIDGRILVRVHGQIVTNRVTISGRGSVRLFSGSYGTSDIAFRNLILEDAYVNPGGYAPATCGSVVQATSWGTVTFDNCLVRNCHAEGNGGVVDWYGPVVMRNSVFENNTAAHMGGVVCLNGGGVMVEGCSFTDNVGQTMAGVFRVDGDSSFYDCVFTGNYGYSGGVVFGKGSYLFERCRFSGNASASRGRTICTYTYLLPDEVLPKRSVIFRDCMLQGTGSSEIDLQPDYLFTIIP